MESQQKVQPLTEAQACEWNEAFSAEVVAPASWVAARGHIGQLVEVFPTEVGDERKRPAESLRRGMARGTCAGDP